MFTCLMTPKLRHEMSMWHFFLFYAECKCNMSSLVVQEAAPSSSQALKRAFVRTMLRNVDVQFGSSAAAQAAAAIGCAESALGPCMAELKRLGTQSGGAVDWASIFVMLLPLVSLDESACEEELAAALRSTAAAAVGRQAAEMRLAAVAELVVRVQVQAGAGGNAAVSGWRVVVSLPSGAHQRACCSLFAQRLPCNTLRLLLWPCNHCKPAAR
jgi:hypothetical protein